MEIDEVIETLKKLRAQLDEGASVSSYYGPDVIEIAFYRDKIELIKDAIESAVHLLSSSKSELDWSEVKE